MQFKECTSPHCCMVATTMKSLFSGCLGSQQCLFGRSGPCQVLSSRTTHNLWKCSDGEPSPVCPRVCRLPCNSLVASQFPSLDRLLSCDIQWNVWKTTAWEEQCAVYVPLFESSTRTVATILVHDHFGGGSETSCRRSVAMYSSSQSLANWNWVVGGAATYMQASREDDLLVQGAYGVVDFPS